MHCSVRILVGLPPFNCYKYSETGKGIGIAMDGHYLILIAVFINNYQL